MDEHDHKHQCACMGDKMHDCSCGEMEHACSCGDHAPGFSCSCNCGM